MTPTPLHERNMAINPQSASPLYNGRIPPEIRDQIFTLAMGEYTKTDPASQYNKSTNHAPVRPGYTGARAVTASLLLTCRRVYKETYHLPVISKEHVFWHERPPTFDNGRDSTYVDELQYFRRMTPWQVESVKEIHLFMQMFLLERDLIFLCKHYFMQRIERIKITIRRGDWWWNERNAPLGICPQSGSAQNGEMLKEWEREKKGQVIPWKEGAWGYAFAELHSLKELEMEFETSEDKVEELKVILEKAKEWKFPLKNDMVLSAEGLEAETTEWRSDACYWSDTCPYCNYGRRCFDRPELEEKCKEKLKLKEEGKGPMVSILVADLPHVKVPRMFFTPGNIISFETFLRLGHPSAFHLLTTRVATDYRHEPEMEGCEERRSELGDV
jgi:hypothetical protein